MKQTITTGVIAFITGIAVVSLIIAFKPQEQPETYVGSVVQSSEYHATTTSQGRFSSSILLKEGQGTLGSVIITGADTGIINLYNATTTDVTKRTGNTATSTIYMATLPASTVAGTYTFDSMFFDGLYIEIIGATPTTTITYR